MRFFAPQTAPAGLTSNGVPVHYEISADGRTLTAFSGEGDAKAAVFVVTLDRTAVNGAYSFKLLGALDHRLDRGAVGHVDLAWLHLAALPLRQFGRLAGGRLVEVGAEDSRALTGVADRDGPPVAAAAARDDRNLTF